MMRVHPVGLRLIEDTEGVFKYCEMRLNEPESMVEVGWFRLDKLPSPLHKGTKENLENLKEYFAKYLKR